MISDLSNGRNVIFDAQFDDIGGTLNIGWDLDRNCFGHHYGKRLFDEFMQTLDCLGSEGSVEVSLSACTKAWAEHELNAITSWNATALPFQQETCLSDMRFCNLHSSHRFIEEVWRPQTLSYAEVLVRATSTSCKLVGACNEGDLIGVVMCKGWEQVVGVLAIHMVGCAYLPISSQFPMKRIYHILHLGRSPTALVQPGSEYANSEAQSALGVRVILVQTSKQREQVVVPAVTCGGKELAYVIFTSGTTGAPQLVTSA